MNSNTPTSYAYVDADLVLGACRRYRAMRRERIDDAFEKLVQKYRKRRFGKERSLEQAQELAREDEDFDKLVRFGLLTDHKVANLYALAKLSLSCGDQTVCLSDELAGILNNYFSKTPLK